jgi:hypothetical protein
LGWSGTEYTVAEDITDLLYQLLMMGDNECGAVSGMLGKGDTEVLSENLTQFCFGHHKSHMT